MIIKMLKEKKSKNEILMMIKTTPMVMVMQIIKTEN